MTLTAAFSYAQLFMWMLERCDVMWLLLLSGIKFLIAWLPLSCKAFLAGIC